MVLPSPYIGQVLYGPPTCMYGPLHVKYLHVLHDLWSPYLISNRYCMIPPHVSMAPLPYIEQVLYGPPTCTYAPYI